MILIKLDFGIELVILQNQCKRNI